MNQTTHEQRWKPNVTVAAVIYKDDKYLVVEEKSHERIVINQPAGHIEENESLVEAVCREVLEETAYEFNPDSLIGTYLYPNSTDEITYLRFCFTGTTGTHHPEQQLDDGIIRAVWMSMEELLANEDQLRSPLVLQCIDDYLAGIRYPLDLLHYAADKS